MKMDELKALDHPEVDAMTRALRLTPEQLTDLKARVSTRPTVSAMRDNPAEREVKEVRS